MSGTSIVLVWLSVLAEVCNLVVHHDKLICGGSEVFTQVRLSRTAVSS